MKGEKVKGYPEGHSFKGHGEGDGQYLDKALHLVAGAINNIFMGGA